MSHDERAGLAGLCPRRNGQTQGTTLSTFLPLYETSVGLELALLPARAEGGLTMIKVQGWCLIVSRASLALALVAVLKPSAAAHSLPLVQGLQPALPGFSCRVGGVIFASRQPPASTAPDNGCGFVCVCVLFLFRCPFFFLLSDACKGED